jgi:hypothetical protein
MSSTNANSPVPRLVVGPNEAEVMLDCGHTYLYRLINAGELDSYLEGKARKITVESIHARIRRKLQDAKAV